MPEIRNLTIQHRVSGRTLVSDLSFTIQAGDRIAIIGEEGNGKSTLLKYLYDPALVAPYADVTGSVRMDGRRAGFLYQELPETEQSKSVCDFLTGRGAFDTAADSELLRRASELGLAPERIYSEQRVSTLSGGEKVKLQLLAVLAGRPDLLMLDEPTNDIDIETLQYLTEFLLHTPLPVLYVSHDETLLEDTATAVIHLEQLHLKTECRSGFYRLPYRVYVESRMSAFQRQEQRARKEAAEYRAKVERYRRLFERVQADQNRISRGDPHGGRLLKKKMHAVKSVGRRLESEEKRLTALPVFEDAIKLAFPPILQPRGKEILRCSLPELSVAGRVLCRNVELVVHGGEHVGIFGKKRRRQDHAARTHCGGAARTKRRSHILHAAELCGAAAPGLHVGRVSCAGRRQGGRHRCKAADGQRALYARGDACAHRRALRRTAGKALPAAPDPVRR